MPPEIMTLLIGAGVALIPSIADATLKTNPNSIFGKVLSILAVNVGKAKNDPAKNIGAP